MKQVSLDVTQAVSLVPKNNDYSTPISILPILALIPQLEPFKVAAANVTGQAERAVIDSEEAWQKGSDFLTVCSDQWDQLEALRKAVKGPVDDYGKFIQSIFVPLQQNFLLAKGAVNERMRLFQKAEDARRLAAAEAVRKANEEAASKLAQEAEDRGDSATASAILDVATTAPVPVPRTRLGGTNSYGKSHHIVKRWTASVDSPMQLLQAILDGKVPISIIEWKQAELNKVAANLRVEKIVHGIKVFQTENLQ